MASKQKGPGVMKELVLIQLNDLHGYMEPHAEWFLRGGEFVYRTAGGLARIKATVDELRQRHGQVLFTDNGDTFHGTPAVVRTQGKILLPMLRRLGLDAMTGHWDFAYGPEALLELVAELNYPFVAANVYWKESGDRVFPPSLTLEVNGVRIGLVGLAATIIDKVMPSSFSKGIRFTDGVEELPELILQLRERERVDLVVLLSHLGLPQDLELLERVAGVDVCLSGHTHNRLTQPLKAGDTLVIQSGCHGSFLGMLRVGVAGGRCELLEHRLMAMEQDLPEEAEMKELVESALQPFREELEREIGTTAVGLNRATMLESSADTALLEAMRAATGAELAFANGWRYGAPIPAGPVTMGAVMHLAPMDPEIELVDLTGAELERMIEENLERTFSRRPFGQMGGYVKRCAGMRTFFKVENPSGTRVQTIFVSGEPLDRERLYKAAYITSQAVPDHVGSNRAKSGVRLSEAIAEFFTRGELRELPRGSFVEV